MHIERIANVIRIKFQAGVTDSEVFDIGGGTFGTILVPPGSELITKDLQFIAVDGDVMVPQSSRFPDTELMSAAKTLVSGANPLTATEAQQVGAAKFVKLRVLPAPIGPASMTLLWK